MKLKKKLVIASRIMILVAYIIIIALMLWVALSWVNVILHNTDPNGAQYIWDCNVFKMITELSR